MADNNKSNKSEEIRKFDETVKNVNKHYIHNTSDAELVWLLDECVNELKTRTIKLQEIKT